MIYIWAFFDPYVHIHVYTQDRTKLFYGGGNGGLSANVGHHGWSKTENKKKAWLKHPKAVPQKTKFGHQYKWFKISHLKFFFMKILFRVYIFFYLSTRSSGHHQSFFYFRFFNRKSQRQQKLARKSNHFTIQFRSKNLTYFENLSSLDIENNMLPQHR